MTVAAFARWFGNQLYKFAFPLYRTLYSAFKSHTDRLERSFLKGLLHPGDVVVDAGANIGIYTQFLSECVGDAGFVHSFEPDRTNFRRLHDTLASRQNIRLNELAVADRTGESALYVSGNLNVDHRAYPTEGEQRRRVVIRATRLDDYFPPGERVDFIKADIQGFELNALRGAERVLADNPSLRLLLEFWPYGLRCSGNSPTGLIAFLQERGYSCHTVTARGLIPFALEAAHDYDPDYYTNLFAQPAPR